MKLGKLKTWAFAREMFGFGLLIGGLIRYAIAGPLDEMTVKESFGILFIFIIAVYFIHSGRSTDLLARIKELERRNENVETKTWPRR